MTPEDAFTQFIETGNASFVSRGDDSGTHGKEKAIWASAGYDYNEDILDSGAWYIEAGSGMGPTLVMASEKRAYTLSDMGTFLSYQGDVDLVAIVDKGSVLLNVYSVIACNPEVNVNVNYEMAENMVDFLTSNEIQELIGNYGTDQYGTSLFTPGAGNEPTS
jgi:tungstate transport system substrate-binding protein